MKLFLTFFVISVAFLAFATWYFWPLFAILVYDYNFETSEGRIDASLYVAKIIDNFFGTNFYNTIKKLAQWVPREEYDDIEQAAKGTVVEVLASGVSNLGVFVSGIASFAEVRPEDVAEKVEELRPDLLYFYILEETPTFKEIETVIKDAPNVVIWHSQVTGESVYNFISKGEGLKDLSKHWGGAIKDIFSKYDNFTSKIPVIGGLISKFNKTVVGPAIDFVTDAANAVANFAETAVKEVGKAFEKAWDTFISWF